MIRTFGQAGEDRPRKTQARPWRILIIDDSPEDRAEVRRLLLWGSGRRYEFEEAETGERGLAAIVGSSPMPDCVILDYNLPDTNASEVLLSLVLPDGGCICPVVVVTGAEDIEAGAALLRAGAQDFVAKSWLSPAMLVRVLENASERWTMDRELRSREAERARAEAALRASEERLRLTLEASDIGLWTWDLRTDAATWSPEGHQFYGVSEGLFDGTGASFSHLIHPDDRVRVEQELQTAVSVRAPSECEFRLVRPDGRVVWVHSRGRTSYDEAGVPLRMLGTITDVTDRKGREQQRAEQARLLDLSDDAILVRDLDDRIVYWNQGAQRCYGFSRDEALGRISHDLLRTRHPVSIAEIRETLLRSGRWEGELQHTCRDGTSIIVSSRWSLDRDEWGLPGSILETNRDITWRKRAEAEIARSEAFAASVIEASPDCVSVLSLAGRLLWMNENGKRLMEIVDFSMSIGGDWAGLWEPHGLRPVVEAALAVARRGGVERFRGFCPTTAGSPRWWDVAVSAIPAADGQIEQILVVSRDVTEARRVDEALRASEDSLRLSLTWARAGTWAGDLRDGGVFWSAELFSLFGVDPESGVPSSETRKGLVHPADRYRAESEYAQAVARGGQFSITFRVIRPLDGEMLWVSSLGRIEHDARGRPTLVRGLFQDVTAKQEAEARFRQLADAMPQMVFASRPDGNTDYYNERWYGLTGFPRDLGGDRVGWIAIVHPDDREQAFAAWTTAVRQGSPFECEFRFSDQATGEYRWYLGRALSVQNESGAIVRWYGTCTEIHEHKRLEEALLSRERELRTLADNSPDLIARLDRDLRHVFVNAAAERATGQPVDNLIGKTNREIGLPADRCDLWDAAIRSVFETGEHRLLPWVFDDSDGLRHYDTRLVPEFGADNKVEYVLSISHDVTLDKTYAQKLRDADERKDEFLATLSHELRNPLAAIRNGLEVLHRTQDVEAAQRVRKIMDRQLSQVVWLVNELLEVSRIGAGKVMLRPERVPLQVGIESAAESARPLIDSAGHTLILDLPPDPVWLDADLVRLVQVFSNLFTNAVKYTSDGGLITVSGRRNGEEAVITITDTGCGIDAEMLERVFDMFVQVRRTAARSQGGLGVGLGIARRLVELHGGTIIAASPGAGKGSTFTVRLPLASIETD